MPAKRASMRSRPVHRVGATIPKPARQRGCPPGLGKRELIGRWCSGNGQPCGGRPDTSAESTSPPELDLMCERVRCPWSTRRSHRGDADLGEATSQPKTMCQRISPGIDDRVDVVDGINVNRTDQVIDWIRVLAEGTVERATNGRPDQFGTSSPSSCRLGCESVVQILIHI